MPQRRAMIDAIRGLCLVNIFVNHIENGAFTLLSPSRLGFSDSSDIFVLVSGISTALAARQASRRQFGAVAAHLWRRAAHLYAVEAILVLSTLGLLAAILTLRGVGGAQAVEIGLLRDHGTATLLWHALTLGQTVGYPCVLRLYIALMLFAPILLRLALWRVWAPLPPAILLWASAGHYGWVLPNSLSGIPFTQTILPWTLLFTIGIVVGQGMNLGLRLPCNRWIVGLALGYLAGSLAFLMLAPLWPSAQDWIATRNDRFWFGASKTYLSPLRVLHVLALAYLVMALPKAPLIRMLHQVRRDHGLARLGRRSLQVFTIGALAAVVASELLDLAALRLNGAWFPVMLLEAALIGLFVGLALRLARPRHRTASRSEPAPEVPTTGQRIPDALHPTPALA